MGGVYIPRKIELFIFTVASKNDVTFNEAIKLVVADWKLIQETKGNMDYTLPTKNYKLEDDNDGN